MPETRFRKGDLVTFELGMQTVRGQVKEDRGPIGVRGRHLYLVEFRMGSDSDGPSEVELPAEELRPVQGPASVR